MRKAIIKTVAAACAAFLALTASGCADTTWAAKVNGSTIPSGVYITYLISYAQSVEEGTAGSSSSSSSASSPLTATAGSSSSSAVKDVWSQKVDGDSAVSWAINKAMNDCKSLAVTEQLCKEKNLSLTSTETSTIQSYASSIYSQYTIYKNNGVSQSSFERILGVNYYLSSKLFNSYYAKGGTNAVSDDELKNYYTSNFVHIKQIFFNKYDTSSSSSSSTSSSSTLLSAQKQAEKKAKADSILAQVLADKSKFDTLMKDNNEDTGESTDGYIFDKNESYLQSFIDTAYSMKVGDVQLIETTQGWHVMYKVPVDPTASSYDDTQKATVLQSMKSADFQKILDAAVAKATLVRNEKTINRYSPKKLKSS